MNCPRCGAPMHKSSIGLYICLSCGYTMAADDLNPYQATALANEQQTNHSSAIPSPNSELPIETYLANIRNPDLNTHGSLLSSLVSLSKTKKLLLALAVCLAIIVTSLGSLLSYQNKQTNHLLQQAITADQQGNFKAASSLLQKARKAYGYASTKQAVNNEIANNTTWQKDQAWQNQASHLINAQQYTAALALLNNITSSYPLYSDVQNLIALAESGGNPIAAATIAVQSNTANDSSGSNGGSTAITVAAIHNNGSISLPVSNQNHTAPISSSGSSTNTQPTTQPTPTPTPTPTPKYVYKGDGTTKIGQFVSYANGVAACANIIYLDSSGNQQQLTTAQCFNISYTETVYFAKSTSCQYSNSEFLDESIAKNLQPNTYFVNDGQLWQQGYGDALGWNYNSFLSPSGTCQSSPATYTGAFMYPVTKVGPYTPPLCGSSPCIVK